MTDNLLEVPLLSPAEQARLESMDEAARKVLLIMRTFNRYCANNLKIKTKDGQLVALEPNRVQRKIIEKVVGCILDGKPIRFIILKARQEGVSTIVEALIYWWTATHKYIQSKIIAHDTPTSEYLYNMFRTYYENSNPLFAPTTKYHTRSDLTFDNESDPEKGLKSQIDTATAENAGSGRGQTIQWLHGSEVAKWRNGRELVAGLMQAVPLLPYTAIFLESTANGIGDYFHTTWQAAKRGESAFEPLFFGWDVHEEYCLPVPPHFRRTVEEEKLVESHKLTNGQLAWRRAKLREFVGDEKRFFQEYPLTDTEAFLASGSPRFNIDRLMEMEAGCYEPKYMDLSEKRALLQAPEFVVRELEGAPLKVWFYPQDSHQYVIGVDVAEGIEEDYCVATVMDKADQKTVARFRGDLEPGSFGIYLDILGRWYNEALIGVEVNNHGLTTIQSLRDVGYQHLYRRESGMDERYEEYTSKLGWRTDVRTKPLMIDHLAIAISEQRIIDYDKIFVRESMTYVRDERGRTNAQEGQHDDCFVAGTQILTDKGQVPIEDISIGDKVMTRAGLQPVVMTRNKLKPVISNLNLRGTPDHPVITVEGEKALSQVGNNDKLHIWNPAEQKIEKLSFTEARNIIATRTPNDASSVSIIGGTINGKLRRSPSTAKYGLTLMDRYLKGTSSTIRMKTRQITSPITWNPYLSRPTLSTIWQAGQFQSGIVPDAASFSTISTTVTPSTAPTNAGAGTIERVYNLQVANQPEYFANNVLVHNCVISTAICLQLFEWNPINQRKLAVRSRYPERYQAQHRRNAGLRKIGSGKG